MNAGTPTAVSDNPEVADELGGVLVADFTTRGPGPYLTQLLLRLGARVIKFEPPEGDPARAMPMFFSALNAGKESVECDLRSPDGRSLAIAASTRADVVVNSWRPGVAERYGLGGATLHRSNPALIHCTVSGYGAGGPLEGRPGQDLSYLAASGALPFVTSRGPEVPGLPWGDTLAGFHGAMRVCAALLASHLLGTGKTIEVSVAGTLAEPALLAQSVARTPLSANVQVAGKGIFRTSDGKLLAIAVISEARFWRSLCDSIGLVQIRHCTFDDRLTRSVELQDQLKNRLEGLTSAEVEMRLGEAEVPWAWVTQPGDAILGGGVPQGPTHAEALGASGAAVREEFDRPN